MMALRKSSYSSVVSGTCVEDNMKNNWRIKHDAAGRDRSITDIKNLNKKPLLSQRAQRVDRA